MRVATFDFSFRNIVADRQELPGNPIRRPPAWDGNAVSAHTNLTRVAAYLRHVVFRDGVDNLGSPLVASVNCVGADAPGRDWPNAQWVAFKRQVVFGQLRVPAGPGESVLRSYAASPELVAHEVFHGVTDSSSHLSFVGMPGALNESYSDIFGVLVRNADEGDIGRWLWTIGVGLGSDGGAIRDLREPSRFGQPEHMNDYRQLPLGEDSDWGGVHVNSGIHNKAAYRLMNSRGSGGHFLFQPMALAYVFHRALTMHLSRQSTFADSRAAIRLSVQTLFRAGPQSRLERAVAAVAAAFDGAGIVEP
jgi:Zn-dependent metalloprotease